jgi:hypothetical protein
MIETATQTTGIQTVAEVRSVDGDVELTLSDGVKARLSADHPNHASILRQAEWSLCDGRPMGVLLDSAGRIVDLKHAVQTSVRRVQDCEEDPNRLEVGFWGYSPVCYVTRDHPDFERIRTTLEQAVESGKPVWLATYTWPETSETEIWVKIMDVRPGDWAETAPLRNGAA